MSKSVLHSSMPPVLRLFSISSPFVSFVNRLVSFSTTCRYFACSSGGIVPSSIASRNPFMEVSGERKSWDTFAMNFF